MKTLQSSFDQLEDVLLRNIANHIIAYEFHAKATEEELVAYYGGAYTSRDMLLADTISRMASDQMQLKFLQENKGHLIETYGDKNPTGDIGLTLQRATGVSAQPTSESEDAGETGTGESAEPSAERTDDADRGDHSEESEDGDRGSSRTGGAETE